MKRRTFLSAAALASTALAIEPFARDTAQFSGLGLTTYSLKRHMKWWWGKPNKDEGGQQLEMADFLDYCAELGLEGAEITSYFFPEPLEKPEIHALKRRTQILGLDITGAAMGNNFAFPPGSDENPRPHEILPHLDRPLRGLGARSCVCLPRESCRKASDEKIIENVIANLNEALAYAEKRG